MKYNEKFHIKEVILTSISFGLSANKCLYLNASVRIRHLCSEENFIASTLLPFFMTSVKSWFAAEFECLAEATVMMSEYSHLFVTSRRSGLYVVMPWVPIENTRWYFPLQECFVTRKEATSWLSLRGIILALPEKQNKYKNKLNVNIGVNKIKLCWKFCYVMR